MKGERKSTIILCIYVIIMLIVCALTVQVLKRAAPNHDISEEITTDITAPITEIVYIPVFSETDTETATETESETQTSETEYTVKSYEGKIGIFTDNGTLIRVIDVYIKTLPKADRTLLEKGFVVLGETELYAIIEDYTG